MESADKSDILALRKTIGIMLDKMDEEKAKVSLLTDLVKVLTHKVDTATNSITFFLNEDVPYYPEEPS